MMSQLDLGGFEWQHAMYRKINKSQFSIKPRSELDILA